MCHCECHMLTKTNKVNRLLPSIHLSRSILSPVMWTTAWCCGEHSSSQRAWLIFNRMVWIRCSMPWNSRNTRSALTFLLYLLNRHTSLGCLTDTQSHLLHKSQRSAERSLLQTCQDKQNMLDYKYTLPPNSMHLWTKNIQNRLAQRKT